MKGLLEEPRHPPLGAAAPPNTHPHTSVHDLLFPKQNVMGIWGLMCLFYELDWFRRKPEPSWLMLKVSASSLQRLVIKHTLAGASPLPASRESSAQVLPIQSKRHP